MTYPKTLEKLIMHLKKLPGVGQKTAERYAFELLTWDEAEITPLGNLLLSLKETFNKCAECNALCENNNCRFCNSPQRNQNTLCIVSSQKDLYALEQSNFFTGLYHIIPNTLSPLDQLEIDTAVINAIKERISYRNIKEIILAFDSTVEGDATTLYISQELKALDLSITKPTHGLPLGSSLDFVDKATLHRAFSSRGSL